MSASGLLSDISTKVLNPQNAGLIVLIRPFAEID
jgi:hypothetical protein